MRSAQGKPTLRPSTALRSDTHLKSAVLCRRLLIGRERPFRSMLAGHPRITLTTRGRPPRGRRGLLYDGGLWPRSSRRAGETVGHRAHPLGNHHSAALVLSICACDLLFF